jgi:hypothetical protein
MSKDSSHYQHSLGLETVYSSLISDNKKLQPNANALKKTYLYIKECKEKSISTVHYLHRSFLRIDKESRLQDKTNVYKLILEYRTKLKYTLKNFCIFIRT